MRPSARACATAAVLAALLRVWLPPGRSGVAAQEPQGVPGASLRGRVEISHPARDPEARAGATRLGADLTYAPGERRQAVIYLETAPQSAFESVAPARATMKQERETFLPHVLAIPVGSVVDFPNGDPVFHNVFSFSKSRRFDLGRYPKGDSRAVRFDSPGVVQLFCDIHSHMNAYILVFAHRFFAVTDDQGRYRIEGIPPGRIVVAAWYEGRVRETRVVNVPEGELVMDLDFSFAGS
jgi:plastocyanin